MATVNFRTKYEPKYEPWDEKTPRQGWLGVLNVRSKIRWDDGDTEADIVDASPENRRDLDYDSVAAICERLWPRSVEFFRGLL